MTRLKGMTLSRFIVECQQLYPEATGQFTSFAMRSSITETSPFSPRWKNMPLLVRSALTSSPPVWAATVSERAIRGRASLDPQDHWRAPELQALLHYFREWAHRSGPIHAPPEIHCRRLHWGPRRYRD